ncbi:T-cell receptor gamma alternate reading frame protein [Acridotheres tristis]
MDCIAEGIPDFQHADTHWYRHTPTKAPERILYTGARAISYNDSSYSNKYSSSKKEKESSPPANSEILQRKDENQTTYVCLIEKFYPDVIKVTWTDDEKEVTDNVVKGDTWQSTKEEEYSIASWLTVPAENEDKNYYCKYEHENKKASLPTQDSMKTAPQEEDCGTVFNKDQLMHRTAYLVYIILLLKSSMYYLTILFFIYKMWASAKYGGKKA